MHDVHEESLLFSGLTRTESLILFQEKTRSKKTVYLKSGASAQEENNSELFTKEKASKRGAQFAITIGDASKCPECETMGRVIWVSQDKKTMGVQCRASHREASRPQSQYGATKVPSTKTKKNVVFLTPVR